MPDLRDLHNSSIAAAPPELHEARILDNATAPDQEVRCIVPSLSEQLASDPMPWRPRTTAAGEFWPKRDDRALLAYQVDGPPLIVWWKPEATEPDAVLRGEQGDPGRDGEDGATWHVGTGVPDRSLGADGDFYLDEATGDVYGKAAGSWSVVANIEGPRGADGRDGATGAAGRDGNTVLTTSGRPSDGTGVDGDFAYDPAASTMYGPKASGAWPAGVSLRGADGATGPAGRDGTNGTNGRDGANGADGAAGEGIYRVRAATTANITISTALNNGDTLDGVSLVTGDRVLVKDQSTASQNGLYVVAASPARATDADGAGEFQSGSVVVVSEGDQHKDSMWMLATNGTITHGTTGIAFKRVGEYMRYAEVLTEQAVGSNTNYVDLATAGPSVTVVVPSNALVHLMVELEGVQSGGPSFAAAVHEATDNPISGTAHANTNALIYDNTSSYVKHWTRPFSGGASIQALTRVSGGFRSGWIVVPATAGTRTYKVMYGRTGATVNFKNRRLWVKVSVPVD